jgi:beta-lactamase family protein
MRIDWVNHASFIVSEGNVRLLADPWLDGTAFDNGWKHLVPSPIAPEGLDRISHIWLSHEHPDHFSPPNLQRIRPEVRKALTVLFQETADRKVVDFSRNAGFGSIIEMEPNRWYTIGTELRLRCRPVPGGDSWLCVDSPGQRLLNLNDCVLPTRASVRAIRRAIGDRPVDVLLTQFSYANKVGNASDVQMRREEARAHLERVATQIAVLRPRYVIPFASFVWFAHEENVYMNEGMNTVADADRFIRERTDTECIVLYPGESWQVGDQHDSSSSIGRYLPSYELVGRQDLVRRTRSFSEDELLELASKMATTLVRRNGLVVLAALEAVGFLKPVRIYVTDLERTYVLSAKNGLRRRQLDPQNCDVAISSEALSYALRFLWGPSTLLINGRFQVPPGGDPKRFRRLASLASHNNQGVSILRYAPRFLANRRGDI